MKPDPLAPPPGYGMGFPAAVPVVGHDPDFWVSGKCDHGVRWLVADALACGGRSVMVVWVGCKHEHVGQLELCTLHNTVIDSTGILCAACRKAGHPGIQQVPIKRETI
jgi:hypothetical protein